MPRYSATEDGREVVWGPEGDRVVSMRLSVDAMHQRYVHIETRCAFWIDGLPVLRAILPDVQEVAEAWIYHGEEPDGED